MAGPNPAAVPVPPPVPRATPDPLADVETAANWSIDYFNRRASLQYQALFALQVAAGALMGG